MQRKKILTGLGANPDDYSEHNRFSANAGANLSRDRIDLLRNGINTHSWLAPSLGLKRDDVSVYGTTSISNDDLIRILSFRLFLGVLGFEAHLITDDDFQPLSTIQVR